VHIISVFIVENGLGTVCTACTGLPETKHTLNTKPYLRGVGLGVPSKRDVRRVCVTTEAAGRKVGIC